MGRYDEILKKWEREAIRDDLILLVLKLVFFLLIASILIQLKIIVVLA